MGDWDFLHEMGSEGYTQEQIAEAAACGYNPFEWGLLPDSAFSEDSGDLQVVLDGLVENARIYHELTGRYLQIWGELGELYAEIRYGIKRHRPMTQGSDGKLGDDYVEVKTISPEKNSEAVAVKRAGNFNKLVVVKISEDFEFDSRMLDRKKMSKGGTGLARVSWARIPT